MEIRFLRFDSIRISLTLTASVERDYTTAEFGAKFSQVLTMLTTQGLAWRVAYEKYRICASVLFRKFAPQAELQKCHKELMSAGVPTLVNLVTLGTLVT